MNRDAERSLRSLRIGTVAGFLVGMGLLCWVLFFPPSNIQEIRGLVHTGLVYGFGLGLGIVVGIGLIKFFQALLALYR